MDELQDFTESFQGFLRHIIENETIPLAVGRGADVENDVRLIFATNIELNELRQRSAIKGDFLNRVCSHIIRIPPLNERKEDIIEFVRDLCPGRTPTPGFILALLKYDWPGNVRELVEVLENAMRKADLGGGGSTQDKLLLDQLALADDTIISVVRDMEDRIVQVMIYKYFCKLFVKQGYEKRRRGGLSLHKRIATIFDVAESTVTRWSRM